MPRTAPQSQEELFPDDSAVQTDDTTIADGYVLDFIPGATHLKDTPKEQVRQRIARALFHEYGISVEDMEPDFPVRVNGRRKRLDIAIFHHGQAHVTENLSRVVVCRPEPKVGRNAIRMRDYEQAEKDLEELKAAMVEIPTCRYGLASVQNLAAALFRLENSRTPADVQRVLVALVAWLRDPEHESIRRAFTVWLKRVLLPGRLPTVSIPEVQDLAEMQSMLAERVIEWTQQWKEEGLQEGLQQGLAAERALLLRQVRKRFGDACAQALAPLLERRDNLEELAEIGEWIVTYNTSEALLAKVRMVS